MMRDHPPCVLGVDQMPHVGLIGLQVEAFTAGLADNLPQFMVALEVLKVPGPALPHRSSPILPVQLVQQRLGLLEVGSGKAFGEPAVDLGQ
jgi:hypothetical protein